MEHTLSTLKYRREKLKDNTINQERCGEVFSFYTKKKVDSGRKTFEYTIDKNTKLSTSDRTVIASRLYEEVMKIKDAHLIKMQDLAESAEFSSARDLHKVILEKNKDPKKQRLRAYSRDYTNLIKAISKTTNQNFYKLVDKIYHNTNIHPSYDIENSKDEMLLAYLQKVCNKINDKHDLLNIYKVTAHKRIELLRKGGLCNWPFVDLDESNIKESNDVIDDTKSEKKTVLYTFISDDINDNRYNTKQYIRDSKDIRYAYWPSDCEDSGLYYSCLDFYASLKHLPHYYLGDFLNPYEIYGANYNEENYGTKFYDYFDNKNMSKDYNKITTCDYDKHISSAEQGIHTWLIIYPNEDLSGVIPVIYRVGEEDGVLLISLTCTRNISTTEDFFLCSDKSMTMKDVILEKCASPSSAEDFESTIDRTASNLKDNPIFKLIDEEERTIKHMLDYIKQQ